MKPRGIHVQVRFCPSQVKSEVLASLISWNAGTPGFSILALITLCAYCVFQIEGFCGNPALSKLKGTVSPTASAHFLSLSRLAIATFHTFLSLLC